MRRNRTRRDENEGEIVAVLEKAACDVWKLDFPGDLLVGRARRNYLLEVKPPSKRHQLTPAERGFHESWRGQVAVVTTPDEALEAVGLRR